MSYTIIKNKKQYQEYSDKVIELASKNPTKEIEDEMELLELLIDNYEIKIYATETKDPIVLLKSLMEVHQLKSVDLVNILGIQRSAVSQILSYKKGLSKDVIRKLSEHFKLSQEAFNRSYELVPHSNQRSISEKKNETAYLLSNPNNAKALEESKQEIEQGETVRYKLSDLKKPEEINCAVSAGLNASREDWEEASKVMNQNGDDALLDDDNFSDDDLNEWTWEEKI